MNGRGKRSLAAGLVLALSLGLTLPVSAAESIQIGVILPLTGPYAALGDDQEKGAMLAAGMINAKGGVLGKRLKILVRDSELNGGVALRKAKELIFEQKVDFLAGSLSGAVSKVINEFACKNKIIYMGFPQSDMATGQDICRYGFTGMVSPFMASQAMGQFAFQRLGKRWSALTADYRWGQRLLQGWLYASQKQGGRFLGNIYAPLGTKDFSAFLPSILAAGPDFIGFNNLGRDQNAAIKQAHELGIVGRIPIVCTKTTILTMKEVYPLYGPDIYGGVDFYWELAGKYPSAKKFVDAFRQKYGRPPRQDGESAFHQIMTLADAVQRAGGLAPDKVIAALEDGTYAFTKGRESYQKCNHQRAETYLVLQGLGRQAKGWKTAHIIEEVPAKEIMRDCEQAVADQPNAGIALPR